MFKSKKNQKTIILFPLLLIVSLIAASLAGAEEQREPGALTSKPPEESGFITPFATYQFLVGFKSELTMNASSIYIAGHTEAKLAADFISVDVTLQRWDGSAWRSERAVSNSTTHSKSVETNQTVYNLNKGYYYRTLSTHMVRINGTVEKASFYTPGYLYN
ncbi:hypothetical protein TCA2_1909 [Paenibacillus sp. TCA20]|uniref:Uncharacterized protein n=2 Tax=Paenibacillus urinalis TaxID=521520 RepID=A0AAX3MX53_9BACL|nr:MULTISPECIES: hypothetical protein [Paenibacillus]WDH81030.1 hypothetical protein PUW23_15985 [Paenibacillus urinalis]WDI00744.1 hypothetical protein PUW25_15810 [Paenibacillus urinalis]GAK39421.1 hypothetical protein TCA2_1909 [Paenibacillus sp. TCA20]